MVRSDGWLRKMDYMDSSDGGIKRMVEMVGSDGGVGGWIKWWNQING